MITIILKLYKLGKSQEISMGSRIRCEFNMELTCTSVF